MRPKIDNEKDFKDRVELICTLYKMAPELKAIGVNVASTDEKTGIQALERLHPAMPASPGRTRCEEHEYIRHGTTCLTPTMLVATGEIICPTLEQTRGEADFVGHIGRTVQTAPKEGWIFILDNLNTHLSASLVEYVAQELNLDIDLGVKQKSGILKSMQSRKEFLEDPSHRIQFIYTPKHCSWMNQIEVWFSKLSRSILKHGSHTSIDHLEQDILQFIEYHNKTAKPHKWTSTPSEIIRKTLEALNGAVI